LLLLMLLLQWDGLAAARRVEQQHNNNNNIFPCPMSDTILYYNIYARVCVCAQLSTAAARRRGGGALIAGKSRPADHRY